MQSPNNQNKCPNDFLNIKNLAVDTVTDDTDNKNGQVTLCGSLTEDYDFEIMYSSLDCHDTDTSPVILHDYNPQPHRAIKIIMARDQDAKDELVSTARRIRGQLSNYAERAIKGLLDQVHALTAEDTIVESQLIQAEERMATVQGSPDKLSAAIVKCQVAEDMSDEAAQADEYARQAENWTVEFEDKCIELATIRRQFQDARVAAASVLVPKVHGAHGGLPAGAPRSSSDLKPSKLTEGTKLVGFKTWRKTVEDYFTVARINSLNVPNQRAHLRVLMDPNMDNAL
eukprot:maker-scaffold196_size269943-snap-gene-0.13 protein:Tk08142 transcript:maker-scaffold196_size269943-snap-gene-0.13-mRNA-1 annotation:"putative glycosyltransferase"